MQLRRASRAVDTLHPIPQDAEPPTGDYASFAADALGDRAPSDDGLPDTDGLPGELVALLGHAPTSIERVYLQLTGVEFQATLRRPPSRDEFDCAMARFAQGPLADAEADVRGWVDVLDELTAATVPFRKLAITELDALRDEVARLPEPLRGPWSTTLGAAATGDAHRDVELAPTRGPPTSIPLFGIELTATAGKDEFQALEDALVEASGSTVGVDRLHQAATKGVGAVFTLLGSYVPDDVPIGECTALLTAIAERYVEWVTTPPWAPKPMVDEPIDYRGDTDITVDANGHDEYRGTFYGSTFPYAPYRDDLKITLNESMTDEYVPALDRVLPDVTKGMRLLLIAMTNKEGFYPASKNRAASRSYRTHNPGNVGNLDDRTDTQLPTLDEGIVLQAAKIEAIANGRDPNFPKIGETRPIDPTWSSEIADHEQNYRMSPYLPGYNFEYTGQLEQFLKYYSTAARAGNGYVNAIVSYFKQNGIAITPQTTLLEIISIDD